MRIECPYCGERDLREFKYRGHALALLRPDKGAGPAQWDDFLHNRDNPAGMTEDLWRHDPCGSWLVAERSTVTHEIRATRAVRNIPA